MRDLFAPRSSSGFQLMCLSSPEGAVAIRAPQSAFEIVRMLLSLSKWKSWFFINILPRIIRLLYLLLREIVNQTYSQSKFRLPQFIEPQTIVFLAASLKEEIFYSSERILLIAIKRKGKIWEAVEEVVQVWPCVIISFIAHALFINFLPGSTAVGFFWGTEFC